MKKNLHIISRVLPDSIGEELELEPGDALLSINGQPVEDVFDYRYLMNDEFVTLLIRKKNGEEWELEVEKEDEDDLGVEFENSLMDEYRSCSNQKKLTENLLNSVKSWLNANSSVLFLRDTAKNHLL